MYQHHIRKLGSSRSSSAAMNIIKASISNVHVTANGSSSVGIIEFGDGRLNPLGHRTLHNLMDRLDLWRLDEGCKCIVLVGRGNHFSAGADLTEFEQQQRLQSSISLPSLIDYIESYPKPVVAAIQGVALGGGLELAMSCHFRVATSNCQLGLPEVQVGLIPGAGGTQRLPRLVGIEKAIEMILRGTKITGNQALPLGLIDGIVPNSVSVVGESAAATGGGQSSSTLIDHAAQWAHWACRLTHLPRVKDRTLDETSVHAACDASWKRLPKLGMAASKASLQALRASPSWDIALEQKLFLDMMIHPEGIARRHAFFAVRTAQKPRFSKAFKSSLPSHFNSNAPVGVVGAGLMGSGIAYVLLQAGFFVHIVDIDENSLQKGMQFIKKNISKAAKQKKWNQTMIDVFTNRLIPSTNLQDLKHCLLIVEAVLESMSVKHKVFKTLDEFTRRDAILLSNTSTLSIGALASVLLPYRRDKFAGWHFFSPAHMMPLVEIVVGSETSDATTALLQSVTKQIGKIGVIVGNCPGFVGNRMVAPYTGEAALLLAEGVATVQTVDAALSEVHGMAMGPFRMGDLAGNDIGYFIRMEAGLTRDPETNRVGINRGNRRYTELVDDVVTVLGRLGQKAGKGWYDYEASSVTGKMTAVPSAEVTEFCQNYHPQTPTVPLNQLGSQEIIERVLFPLVNEGFKILEENIVQHPSDIDVIYLYGYGWPAWRGGPMFWADNEVGLSYLLEKLQLWYQTYPGSDWFLPSNLLLTCVELGVTVEAYYGKHRKSNL
jgi:3-hydroxyacyl-CoA dehydrogenase/enoyl-CoA hydratase/carnithine racemase